MVPVILIAALSCAAVAALGSAFYFGRGRTVAAGLLAVVFAVPLAVLAASEVQGLPSAYESPAPTLRRIWNARDAGQIAAGLLMGAGVPLAAAFAAHRFAPDAAKGALMAAGAMSMSTAVFFSLLGTMTQLPSAGPVRGAGDIAAAPGVKVMPFITTTLFRPTALAIDSSDRLYIATGDSGVFRATDTDGDNVADEVVEVANVGQLTLGVATVDGRTVYISNSGSVYRVSDPDGDGRGNSVDEIVTGLPAQVFMAHSTNNMAIGQDGRIYLGVGGTSDQGPEEFEHGGTVVSFDDDGSGLEVYATGLRNPYGVAFIPDGRLLITDNGPDFITEAVSWEPPSELNVADRPGSDFGYPGVFGFPPPGSSTRGPVALFRNTDVPTGVAYYNGGGLPEVFDNSALVTLWGAEEESSLVAVSIDDIDSGAIPAPVRTVATGFGNVISVAVDSRGRVYAADYSSNTIYVLVSVTDGTE